jgi:hypothetical protein
VEGGIRDVGVSGYATDGVARAAGCGVSLIVGGLMFGMLLHA